MNPQGMAWLPRVMASYGGLRMQLTMAKFDAVCHHKFAGLARLLSRIDGCYAVKQSLPALAERFSLALIFA